MLTKEDKDLLLKDLSGRIPYGVKCSVGQNDTRKLEGIHIDADGSVRYIFGLLDLSYDCPPIPYLRPIISMTEEEMNTYERLYYHRPIELAEFVNSHHLDYNGLIPKGLALPLNEMGGLLKQGDKYRITDSVMRHLIGKTVTIQSLSVISAGVNFYNTTIDDMNDCPLVCSEKVLEKV